MRSRVNRVKCTKHVVLHCLTQAYGFRSIQNIVRRIKTGKCAYHFIEIMACPQGACVLERVNGTPWRACWIISIERLL